MIFYCNNHRIFIVIITVEQYFFANLDGIFFFFTGSARSFFIVFIGVTSLRRFIDDVGTEIGLLLDAKRYNPSSGGPVGGAKVQN